MASNKIDLDSMSLDDLKKLRNEIDVAIDNYEKRKRQEAKAALEAKARELGYSLDELVGEGKQKARPQKSAPKYADPADPSKTWTGRGRKPKWLEAYLDQGKTLDDLKI